MLIVYYILIEVTLIITCQVNPLQSQCKDNEYKSFLVLLLLTVDKLKTGDVVSMNVVVLITVTYIQHI